jgi:hypothetical protein
MEFKGVDQAIPIEMPIVRSGEQAVPPEIVDSVHIKLAGKQELLPGGVIVVFRIDQLADRTR